MGKPSCMISANSKEELDQIRAQSPFAVTMVRSDGCSHCQEIHPVVEKRCKDVEGYIPVIDCPVDKQFCMDELRGLKKEGIPLIFGTERGNPKKPVFVIEGSDKKELHRNFDILKQMVDNAKKGTKKDSLQRQQSTHSGENIGIPQAPPQRGSNVDEIINAVLGVKPLGKNREPVMLCTPGYDCNSNEYDEQAIRFLLSRKDSRN